MSETTTTAVLSKPRLKQRYQERLDALQKIYDGIDKPL